MRRLLSLLASLTALSLSALSAGAQEAPPLEFALADFPPLYVAPIVKATIIEATSGGRSTLEAPCVTSFVDWPPASLPLRGVSRSRTRKSGGLRITRL